MSTEQPDQPAAAVPPAEPGSLPVTDREEVEALRAATLGDYDVAGELGRGGMATVYLAHDIALDRKVAIKVMSQALSLGDGVERFRREAKTAASLSHPNIIPIYAVQRTERLLYFVMKYVDGRSLDSIIKELGPLPIPMVQAILGQTASAFGYAHRRGVVHRDIKPGNLRVTPEGLLKILPECLRGEGLDPRADIFSAGAVLYEMACGRPPFNDTHPVPLIEAILNGDVPLPSQVYPPVHPALERIIIRALEPQPVRRFARATDLAEVLESLIDRESPMTNHRIKRSADHDSRSVNW